MTPPGAGRRRPGGCSVDDVARVAGTEDLLTRVERVLSASLRRRVQAHGGDVVVRRVTAHGVVHIGFRAACAGCGLRQVTLAAIEKALEVLPEVSAVECEVTVSPIARQRMEAFFDLDAGHRRSEHLPGPAGDRS